MKGADIVVEALAREGVELIFGYPGGTSMEIHQAITRSKIRNVLCRHEQGEIFAAEGYAKASGKVGVCMATSGPGATNLVTGLADAKMDSVPVVAITGQVPTHLMGGDAFQETPIIEVTRQITKHNFLIDSIEDIPRVIKEAFYIANSGRPGPVLVDIPKDVQQAMDTPIWPDQVSIRSYNPHVRAGRENIELVARAIRESKRPLLYVGGGIVAANAAEELRTFARKTGIPVVQTLMGLGVFPETDPLSLQMVGMHGTVYANYAINHADLLLAMGVRFDDRVTGKLEEFCKHGRIVHIDIDPSEINKNKEANIPVVSDIKYALEDLNGIVDEGDYETWHAELASWREKHPLTYQETDDEILPQHAIDLLWKKTKGQAVISTGVGQHQMWAAQYYLFDEPRNWLTSGGLGAMGFGLPSAIGAQLARPGELVIDIDGDGSFVMNCQELATLYAEKIPVKIMILNNQHLGMVVQWEDRFYQSNRGHTFIGDPYGDGIHPDFAKIAEGFWVPAERIEHKKDLSTALDRMINEDGPYLLDIIVPYQEHVLPMIPSGHTFADIITE
ncbi:MAG TPA: biosynthetic-type acetolactate synthase large subunit [Candidatus Latescibacteria bacterium]|nr:acetolactate synthase, large subunit, biosynthetic type [Gemmatimonadota bacterium]HCR19405.1 biosynthetic-type acetolactate synthase large subunit [Candidatus Latescibacterota bacterium]|tara:strand:- start:319 stop:1998 length:1680 start_codon:yes stop_codon:yes gene_type:complete